MATQLKELNDVGPVLRAPDFALVLEDGEARESESDNRFYPEEHQASFPCLLPAQ